MLGFCLPLWYNKIMSKTQSFTKDELNNLSKDALIMLLLQQTESMKLLTAQVENLDRYPVCRKILQFLHRTGLAAKQKRQILSAPSFHLILRLWR